MSRKFLLLASYFFALILLSAAYSRVFTKSYFWYDDYGFMTSSQHDSIPVPAALNNARPLLAALTSWSFSSVHNLADARLMHVLALLGLLVLLSLITFLVRRWDWGFLVVLASTFGLMLPVFEIYIDWAVCWPYTWFAALSIVAWQLWRQKNPLSHGSSHAASHVRWTRLPTTTFLLLCFLCC